MLSKKERVPRIAFTVRPISTSRFLYGSIKGFLANPAAAVVVSKKVCKTAPLRNKVRRRVYSILRPLIRAGTLKRAVIVYPNKEAVTAPFQDLKKSLIEALKNH